MTFIFCHTEQELLCYVCQNECQLLVIINKHNYRDRGTVLKAILCNFQKIIIIFLNLNNGRNTKDYIF